MKKRTLGSARLSKVELGRQLPATLALSISDTILETLGRGSSPYLATHFQTTFPAGFTINTAGAPSRLSTMKTP